jgi:hypothetical protein
MRLSFFLFLFFIPVIGQAQNKKVLDSLNLAYQNAQSDTFRILVLNRIAWEYRSQKPDTCINLAQ